ncbi:MAG: DUF2304 domain-containing protein [Actinomycetaceae bacterium]|nr:DUF2304 domain-containing protein [Arcanobacterium sp.]MDD7504643.1 DUF2304 domain-containing protein [Actinomycetaceae bacterium]MDY6142646.1 DUF2304 domain-containing protein [Arcanobacterium sp.]
MLIKIVLIAAVLVIAYYLVHFTNNAKNVALRRLLLLLFVAAAIASIIFPDITGYVARFLGVGRGTDLLLYMLVIAFLSYAVVNYRRLNILESRLVELARELAITRADSQSLLQAASHSPVGNSAIDESKADGDVHGNVANAESTAE